MCQDQCMTTKAPLSEVVGNALESTGLSDRQIEAKTGISRLTLKRRLADGSKFTVAELERIATLTDTRVSVLVALAEETAA